MPYWVHVDLYFKKGNSSLPLLGKDLFLLGHHGFDRGREMWHQDRGEIALSALCEKGCWVCMKGLRGLEDKLQTASGSPPLSWWKSHRVLRELTGPCMEGRI